METVLEQNRMIAEFMGIKPKLESPDVYTYSDMPFFSVRENTPENVMNAISKYVKYNSSWDWLIPVIEKIEKLGFIIKTTSSPTISGKWYSHSIELKKSAFESNIIEISSDYSNNESKLSTYYRFCVEFIEWYNKN